MERSKIQNRKSKIQNRRRPIGEVYLRRGRWEWRLYDRPGGRVLAKGSAAGAFEANRALNAARRVSRSPLPLGEG
jgi:hypothetical protein